MSSISPPKYLSLLEWREQERLILADMRKTTKSWLRRGIIATPEQVQIRARKQMTDPSNRKNSTGRPRKAKSG